MKNIVSLNLILSCLLVTPSLLAVSAEATVPADKPAAAEAAAVNPVSEAARNTERLLTALRDGNRSLFLENTTEQLQAAMTDKVFEEARVKLSVLLNRSSSLDYLGSLQKSGSVVYLYRMRPENGGDDALVTTAMTDGKVAGFFVN